MIAINNIDVHIYISKSRINIVPLSEITVPHWYKHGGDAVEVLSEPTDKTFNLFFTHLILIEIQYYSTSF